MVSEMNRAIAGGSVDPDLSKHVHARSHSAGRARRAGLNCSGISLAPGQVTTLVLLGGNPVYTSPADLDFGAALRRVATTIYLWAA